MAQPNWTADSTVIKEERSNKLKFIIAGSLIAIAIIALIVQAIFTSGSYFITVEEYHADVAKYADRDVSISSWVIADSVEFVQIDAANSRLSFDIADDLNNPNNRLTVVAFNQPIPDTMQGGLEESMPVQAIVDGQIGEDGALYASGLKTKCPSRYEGDELVSHSEG